MRLVAADGTILEEIIDATYPIWNEGLTRGGYARWAAVLHSLTAPQFARPLHHPEIGPITVDYLVQTYSWHSRHHVAHITRLREREGW